MAPSRRRESTVVSGLQPAASVSCGSKADLESAGSYEQQLSEVHGQIARLQAMIEDEGKFFILGLILNIIVPKLITLF